LIKNGKSYRVVGRLVGYLNKIIKNALNYKEKPETRGRQQSMTPLHFNRLIRQSKKDPFKSATELKKRLKINATVQTVRTYLREHNLKACSPRKVPLLNARHISKRRSLPYGMGLLFLLRSRPDTLDQGHHGSARIRGYHGYHYGTFRRV